MATIQEQLNRVEWDPTEGAVLIGEVVAVKLAELTTKAGETLRYPVLVIRRADGGEFDGTEVEVRCSRGGLLGPVVAYGVANGDPTGQRVGIRYDGKVPTGGEFEAHRYRVAFENEKAQPIDWAALANGRPAAPLPAPSAETTAAVSDPWSKAEAVAAEAAVATEDEPPF